MVDTSAYSWLFGGTAPANYLSPTQSTSSMPAWYQDAMQGVINQAAAIAAQPYNPFPGPQVAGLNSLQSSAISGAANVGAGANNAFSQAGSKLVNGTANFDPSQFQQYLNPYTSGLNDTIAQLGARNLSENLLPQVNDTFIGGGQFGGTRNADFTGRAVRDTNQDILNAQTQNLDSSYNNAMSSYQGALGRDVTAGATYGSLGTAINQANVGDLGAQLQAGQIGQNQDQSNINAAMQNFQQQTNYPIQGLDIVNSILKGYSPGANLSTFQGNTDFAQNPSNATAGSLGALGLLSMS